MKQVVTWLTPRPLTSIPRETSTKKMFTMSGCFLGDKHPRRRQPLHQRLAQLQQLHQLLLRDLLPLRGLFPRQGGDLLPDRDREFAVIRDYWIRGNWKRCTDILPARCRALPYSQDGCARVTRYSPETSRQCGHLRLRRALARRSRFLNLNPLLHSNAVTTPIL